MESSGVNTFGATVTGQKAAKITMLWGVVPRALDIAVNGIELAVEYRFGRDSFETRSTD